MKLLFLLIPFLIQDPDPQDKVRRIEQAIDWLSESDSDLRQAGRKIVLDAGYNGYVGIEYEGNDLEEMEGIRATKNLLERVGSALS